LGRATVETDRQGGRRARGYSPPPGSNLDAHRRMRQRT
jgi:hypothetical protein